MPQQAWRATDFAGLTPGVEPRRSKSFFVLNGQNYLFDSLGPKSAFGNRFVTPYPLGNPEHVQGLRLHPRAAGDRVFTLTSDGIFEWSESAGGWQTIYLVDTTLEPHRWTQGYLNGYQYFCHPSIGILSYQLATNECSKLATAGSPGHASAIVVNNGRLVAIDSEFEYWSAPSDGQDWVPRLGGPGYQRLSNNVSGNPIMLTSYTKGVLVWTTGGVMRSEFTGDQSVFQHRTVNTEYQPVNSFCTCRIDDDTVVILDKRGLFQSKGDVPTPYAPLFNEFLITYIQENQLDVGQNLRIEWDDKHRLLYVSVSFTVNARYEMAFVLYPPMDKWGQFNESHYGILPIKIGGISRADDYFGFVDSTGRLRFWDQLGSKEIVPSNKSLDSRYRMAQKPVQPFGLETGRVVSSAAEVGSSPTHESQGPSGYYPGDSGTTRAAAEVVGLSAVVQLGLLRFDELSDADDQMTEIVGLSLGNLLSGDQARLTEGFTFQPAGVSTDDWVEGLGLERFALQDLNYVNHGLRIISSVDGATEFCSAVPIMWRFDRGIRYYSCTSTGVWHILELTATQVGEAFHLKSFGLTATYAGRLA